MRLICTLHDQNKAYVLSSYLQKNGIENQLEIITNTDWGSHEYGSVTCQVWSIEEEQCEKALAIANEYLQNPDDPKYFGEPVSSSQPSHPMPQIGSPGSPAVPRIRENVGSITLYLIVICTLLLFATTMTRPTLHTIPKGVPYQPLAWAPIEKKLMFDYPKAFEYIDSIVATYGINSLNTPETLPKAGKTLWEEYAHTSYWQGIYDQLLAKAKNSSTAWNFSAPLFEKERQGEVWRLFTPAILHADFFHLLFNMIWLLVLGKQIEQRVGKWKYILFILIAGILANTAQYLMSGNNFLGFSGVLCAMLTFIWFRQKNAAWEGYLLESWTMGFITFFVLFLFFISVSIFVYEVFTNSYLAFGFGNTAHLTGAFIGYLFSKMKFFAWK